MDIKKLYVHSSKNRKSVEVSKKCGCFTCCNIFDAKKVKKYSEELDGNYTAICPMCNADTLIPDHSVPNLSVSMMSLMYDEYIS